MARGFESKSVQDQQSQDIERADRSKKQVDRDEVERRKHRESLELSRRRVQHELAETKSDLRREQLRAALEHLDNELRKSH